MTKPVIFCKALLLLAGMTLFIVSCKQNNPDQNIPASVNESKQEKSAWNKIDLNAIQATLTQQDIPAIKPANSPKKIAKIKANIQQATDQLNHQALKSLQPSIVTAVQSLKDDLTKPEFKHEKFIIQRIYHVKKFIYKYKDLGSGKIGAVNAQGTFLIPPIYDYIFPSKNCIVLGFNDLFGLMNFDYEYITLPQYEYLLPYQDLFDVAIDKQHGLLDISGKLITPLVLDQITFTYSENLLVARKDDKFGTIDMTTGAIVTPFKFDEIKEFKNGKASARIGDHAFIINPDGTCIMDCDIPPWLY